MDGGYLPMPKGHIFGERTKTMKWARQIPEDPTPGARKRTRDGKRCLKVSVAKTTVPLKIL